MQLDVRDKEIVHNGNREIESCCAGVLESAAYPETAFVVLVFSLTAISMKARAARLNDLSLR